MSIARISSTQIREGPIHFVARNRATLDVDQAVRIAPKKSDDPILRMNGDAIAIFVLFRRRDDRSKRNICEFADPPENIAHLARFNRQLMFVVDVLVGASAATAKIGTLR